MNAMQQLLTEHMAIWTAADTEKKSGRGRASGNAGSVYGIKKLRELILELAVRGKLVPQDANDEPASKLLNHIQAEKAKLVAEGKIKKDKPLVLISADEKLFELPHGWFWARLQDVYDVRDGTHDTPKYQESGFPLVTSKNLYSGTLDFSDIKYISKEDHLKIKDRSGVDKGDILFAMIGSIGNPVIVDSDIEFSIKNVALFKPYSAQLSDTSYLLKYLIRAAINLREEAAGAVQSFVSLGVIRSYLIPIPPLAEQHRIVAKVDELMALCDQLEAQHSNAAEAHEKLVSHLLGTLTQSQSADDFSTNWQRIASHFDTLFNTEASIDALKQTLLQLAVMGKLVPQDPNDEPSSELLKRIQAEKAKLVAEGKIKKDKPLAPISEEEKPFELPKGWVFCRWNSIAIKIGDIDHKMPETVSDGIAYVSPRDFYPNNVIDFNNAKQISKEDYIRLAAKIKPDFGDLIYPRYGTIGENRLVEVQLEFLASYSCAVIKTMNGFINPKYQYIFSISNYCKQQAKAAENKTTQANVGIANIQLYIVPLPPLAEQHRIVAKVDALMALCDQLKTRIPAANQLQQKLADVLIEQAIL
jgi:type I restriction enzyme S subunit